jgi:putative transposase
METDKDHTFWTYGYFTCNVGNVSEETLKKYHRKPRIDKRR